MRSSRENPEKPAVPGDHDANFGTPDHIFIIFSSYSGLNWQDFLKGKITAREITG